MRKVSQGNGARKRIKPVLAIASKSQRIGIGDISGTFDSARTDASSSMVGETPPMEQLAAGLMSLDKTPTAATRSAKADRLRALQGRIEKVGPAEIAGWVWDPQAPDARIRLELMEDESRLSVVTANDSRPYLIQLGCGDGRHGFRIGLNEALLSEGRHTLTLRCADTGSGMPGSPIVFEARKASSEDYSMRSRAAASELRPTFHGYVDKVTDKQILGWIRKADQPSHRCTVVLKEKKHILARTVASQFRHDLLSAGIGDGCYSFVFEPPRSLSDGQDHLLEVVEEETETPITTEPIRWHPDTTIDPATSACLSATELADSQSQLTDIASIIQGVIQRVCNRGNLRLESYRPPEITVSLAKMHSLDDADAIFYSYQTILGHTPDASSFGKLVNALRRGAFDRRQIIESLQLDPKASRARFIEDSPEPGPETANIHDERALYFLSEFLKDSADAFLITAYRNILKRNPDPASLATHRKSMIDGVSQSQILASLLGSEEFKERQVPMAILGVTPDDGLFRLLFSMVEQMSRIIVHHDYEICSIKDRLERARHE